MHISLCNSGYASECTVHGSVSTIVIDLNMLKFILAELVYLEPSRESNIATTTPSGQNLFENLAWSLLNRASE